MTRHWHDDEHRWCPCDEPEGAVRCPKCLGQAAFRLGVAKNIAIEICDVCNGRGALIPTSREENP